MLSGITNDLLGLLDSLGYFGIFLIMFIESGVFPPIPSEIVLGSVGLLIYQGDMNFFIAVLAASLGNMAGTLLLYIMARIGGRPFIDKFGKRLFINPEKIARGEKWIGKNGNIVIFISQMVPGLRSVITIPAGLLKKSVIEVCIYSFFGALLWTSFIIGISYSLGKEWEGFIHKVDSYSNVALLFLLFISVFFVIYKIFQFRKNKIK